MSVAEGVSAGLPGALTAAVVLTGAGFAGTAAPSLLAGTDGHAGGLISVAETVTSGVFDTMSCVEPGPPTTVIGATAAIFTP